MSDDHGSVQSVSMGLRQLVLGAERLRDVLAEQLAIGTSEIVALGYLHDEGPLTPRDLALRLDLTSGSVTALLDRLESSGFVTRQQNPDDRRSLLVAATPAGRHSIQWAYEQLDAAVGASLERFPGLDLGLLGSFLAAAGHEMLERATSSSE